MSPFALTSVPVAQDSQTEIAAAISCLGLSTDSIGSIESFTLFPQVPAELRIKIWQASFIPRRIILQRVASRPRLDIRSSAALLLVNNEAHQVFIRNYPMCL